MLLTSGCSSGSGSGGPPAGREGVVVCCEGLPVQEGVAQYSSVTLWWSIFHSKVFRNKKLAGKAFKYMLHFKWQSLNDYSFTLFKLRWRHLFYYSLPLHQIHLPVGLWLKRLNCWIPTQIEMGLQWLHGVWIHQQTKHGPLNSNKCHNFQQSLDIFQNFSEKFD